MKKHKLRTDFLFPERSFVTGFGSILNIAGEPNKFNASETAEEADIKAIKSDWEIVGQDFKLALKKLLK